MQPEEKLEDVPPPISQISGQDFLDVFTQPTDDAFEQMFDEHGENFEASVWAGQGVNADEWNSSDKLTHLLKIIAEKTPTDTIPVDISRKLLKLLSAKDHRGKHGDLPKEIRSGQHLQSWHKNHVIEELAKHIESSKVALKLPPVAPAVRKIPDWGRKAKELIQFDPDTQDYPENIRGAMSKINLVYRRVNQIYDTIDDIGGNEADVTQKNKTLISNAGNAIGHIFKQERAAGNKIDVHDIALRFVQSHPPTQDQTYKGAAQQKKIIKVFENHVKNPTGGVNAVPPYFQYSKKDKDFRSFKTTLDKDYQISIRPPKKQLKAKAIDVMGPTSLEHAKPAPVVFFPDTKIDKKREQEELAEQFKQQQSQRAAKKPRKKDDPKDRRRRIMAAKDPEVMRSLMLKEKFNLRKQPKTQSNIELASEWDRDILYLDLKHGRKREERPETRNILLRSSWEEIKRVYAGQQKRNQLMQEYLANLRTYGPENEGRYLILI